MPRGETLKNEPVRHHYIPQFILRNFCFDGNRKVYYYDKSKNTFSVQDIRNIFMSKHLYKDEINSPEEPTKIEHDLSIFEREVSHIIKNKFLSGYEITLDMNEDAKLRLFFAIMGFRSERVRNDFSINAKKDSKLMYSYYQKDGNFEDLWKRNLGKLVNCRSIQEVLDSPEIDEPIKIFFCRDTIGLAGMYFVVIERFMCEDFIIGDTYPVAVSGTMRNGFPLHIYSIFPISPERIILMVENGADAAPREVLGFRQNVLMLPKMNQDGTYRIRVKKMYAEEVKPINAMILKEAEIGCIYKTKPV